MGGLVSFCLAFPWQGKSSGIRETEIRSLAVGRLNPKIAFAGTNSAIYKTEDGAKTWQEVFRVSGSLRKVNFLVFESENSKIIYAATDNGLYASTDEGKNWKNIFQGIGNLENICLNLALCENKIYLATRKGLFFSFNKGKTWQRASGTIGQLEISCVALNGNEIYLATPEGLYKSQDNAKSWEKIFALSIPQATEAAQEFDFEIDSELKVSSIRFIAASPDEPEKIYLATNRGIFFSLDSGLTWQRFISNGLIDTDIQHIFIAAKAKNIFCATKNGVFEFKQDRWVSLYQGLTANIVNFISQDNLGNVWLATDKGVFKTEEQVVMLTQNQKSPEILDNFKNEPSIQEIQNRAIEYAEVSPQKIQSWRRRAASKAWLPTVSAGLDRSATELFHWDSGLNPDALVRGRDFYDWDVSVSWNLGELIWNDDQTSIDSRSKLMVELRDDILNEVTRLYFERRRLQAENLLSPPQDKKEEIERNLRLAELTASIDALTEGYFSSELKKNK